VIKIRYSDLPGDLHARVEVDGRRPVIYLQPGLSRAQRRAALRGLPCETDPRLSASRVARAAALDTVKSTARNGTVAIRGYPAGSLFLTALLASGIVCSVFFVSVSIRLIPAPPETGTLPAVRSVSGGDRARDYPRRVAGPANQQVSGPELPSSPGATPAPASAAPSASGLPTEPAQLAASPVPPPTASPAPDPSPTVAVASPAPSASAGDPGGLCVDVGPLGACLSVHG
jgi:hypothetical protein